MQGVPQFASPAKLARLRRAVSGGHSQDRVRPHRLQGGAASALKARAARLLVRHCRHINMRTCMPAASATADLAAVNSSMTADAAIRSCRRRRSGQRDSQQRPPHRARRPRRAPSPGRLRRAATWAGPTASAPSRRALLRGRPGAVRLRTAAGASRRRASTPDGQRPRVSARHQRRSARRAPRAGAAGARLWSAGRGGWPWVAARTGNGLTPHTRWRPPRRASSPRRPAARVWRTAPRRPRQATRPLRRPSSLPRPVRLPAAAAARPNRQQGWLRRAPGCTAWAPARERRAPTQRRSQLRRSRPSGCRRPAQARPRLHR